MTATNVKPQNFSLYQKMIWKLLSILSFSTMTACGPLVEVEMEDPRSGHGIHPVLVKYVQAFEQEYGRTIYDIPMVMTENLPSGRAGECRIFRVGQFREIAISWQSWDNLADHEREMLMFHELGHCVLERKHTKKKFDNGQPLSIMYPSLSPTVDWYDYNREYYLEELLKHLP